jgi:prepilin-type N-terminal cleavage/methylation domain-containing protein
MDKVKHWFTLVELIVVITILAILSTIWFVAYNSYLVWSRDTNRISQLASLSDWLEIYRNNNDLPQPENSVEIRASWSVIWYQWYLWKNILESIQYSKWWLDPKTDNYFSYFLNSDWKSYQLMWFLEETVWKQATDWNKLWALVDPVTNKPIQEISAIKTAWYYDVLLNTWTTYKAVLTNDYTVSWTWYVLYAPMYNKWATECRQWLTELMLSNGQVWSCMNLWATTVWDWSTKPINCWNTSTKNCNEWNTWIWDYYQRWRNEPVNTTVTWATYSSMPLS